MKQFRLAIIIALCVTIIFSSLAATSLAITGNFQIDNTPCVGIVVLFSDAERTQAISYSTGILIAPNVVLTAGHSVTGGQYASVCFDQGPIVCQMDETGKMYYTTNSDIYNGIATPYPEYTTALKNGNDILQTNDVGLIILETPVKEVTTFATLPEVGFADKLAVKTALDVKGYGVNYQVKLTTRGFTWAADIVRCTATVNLLSNNFQGSANYLKCSANSAQNKGGIAYGDSGGPVMYNENGKDVVLAVNALVSNNNCAGVTFHTRIDNPAVLSWINGYL